MTPQEYFEDKSGLVKFHDVIASSSGRETKIWGHVTKADMSEENLILLTIAWTTHKGGLIEDNDLRFFEMMMAIYNPACTYSSELDEFMAPLDQLNGVKTKDKLFATLKRDAPPLSETQDTLYAIVANLLQSPNQAPDLIYLRELCRRLPRLKSANTPSPF